MQENPHLSRKVLLRKPVQSLPGCFPRETPPDGQKASSHPPSAGRNSIGWWPAVCAGARPYHAGPREVRQDFLAAGEPAPGGVRFFHEKPPILSPVVTHPT